MTDPRPLKYVPVPAGTKFAGDPEPVTIEGLPTGGGGPVAAADVSISDPQGGGGNVQQFYDANKAMMETIQNLLQDHATRIAALEAK